GAGGMEGWGRLGAREQAKGAVEFAAGRLGVEMRSDGDRGELGVFAGPEREHIADLVHADLTAERFALRFEPIAHLAIEVAQREATYAAFRGCADLRRGH